jgi:sulfate adenylyltransferase subunit 1
LGNVVLEIARTGDSITLVLDREIDISRGDLITDAQSQPVLSREFQADVCWLDRQALSPMRRYWLKQGSRLTQARITEVMSRRDIAELKDGLWRGTLGLNDIGRVQIRTRDTLALDEYDHQPATGAFILIDDASHQTVAAGMVRLTDLQGEKPDSK